MSRQRRSLKRFADSVGTLAFGGWTRCVAWTAQRAARRLAGDLPVVHDQDAVGGDVTEALAVVVGAFEGRDGADGRGIEDGEVSGEAGLDEAAVRQSRGLRGEGRHLSYRFFEAQDFLLADVVAQDAGGRAPAARMRSLVRERPIGRLGRGVGSEGDERMR